MHKLFYSVSLLIALPLLAALPAQAENSLPPPSTETAAERDARMGWWREARFGMFIHWGLYSGLEGEYQGKSIGGGGVEWFQTRIGLDTGAYAALAKPFFKPAPDCAKAWAKLAKDAGCKYVVLTTKHHEGFDLFDTKLSDYNAKAFTGRDMVREYLDAVRGEGLRAGFYHSLIDWHHPDYDFHKAKRLPYPKDGAKLAGDKPRDQAKYIAFLHGQVVNELMSNYGTIDELWFDFSSPEFDGDAAWGATELLRDIRAKQPGVVVNNRLFRRAEGGSTEEGQSSGKLDPRYGDFTTPEQFIPANGIPGVDFEVCMTINDTWGYSKYDHDWKSTRDLVRNLCDIASKGGNFLLNIGPKGDGSIPPEIVERMEGIGRWMKANGEAIYGTTAGPFPNRPFAGRCTQKPGKLYLHVFDLPKDGRIVLPLANKATKAYLLDGGKPLDAASDGSRVTIRTEGVAPDPAATVVAVEIEGAPEIAALTAGKDGVFALDAADAELHGNSIAVETMDGRSNIGFWLNASDFVSWKIKVEKAGRYEAVMEYALDAGSNGSEFVVKAGNVGCPGKLKSTGNWKTYVSKTVGVLELPAGVQTIEVKGVKKPGEAVMNLRGLTLRPTN